ncbi:MAG: C10 family peptidase, partial [Sedimentisphaerales bacterium]
CLATAMAQVMRYFQYPSASIGSHQFQISVEGHERTVRTRGGDGLGGPYRWDDMVLKPESNCGAVTEAQRQAIGALCYDAGVAAYMLYESGGSASLLPDGKDALLNTFQYGNAVMAYDSGRDISGHLRDVINPNLDAKAPVILAIINPAQPDSGHAVVCDGYGYESSTLYHHLNMGWEGTSDIWYNLPDIDSEGGLFTSVFGCIYNIRISGTGEIISGRVLDVNARPMANVSVYAEATGQTPRMAVTDDRGIYAIEELSPSTTYTIQPEADGYVFSSLLVQTGNSRDGLASSGNRWGIDFRTESAIEALPPLLVYVDAGAPDDPQANDPTRSDPLEDGSAEHPFDAIQEAIDAASAGDVVMILAGTYTGAGNRDLDFKGKAITVRSIDPNDPVLVVMNCQGSSSTPHRGFAFHSYETSSSVLNGVTITGGYYDQGGAIYCEDCAGPTVMNCVFEQNAASIGGAIFNENAGPTLTNCTFNDNSAQAGGAIYSHGELGACSPVLTSCIFSANTAAFNGGAVYSLGEYAEPTLVDCVFIRNSASSDGGGAIRNIMSSGVTLTNCLFVENSAMTYGGAIRCSIGSTAVLNNCTLSGNVAGNGNALACSLDEGRVQAPCTVQIINCILWDGGGEIYNKDDSTIAVTYSDVEGGAENGPWPGEGNIDADPYFADPAADDYHLMSQAGRWDPTSQSWLRDKRTSPCIDVGDASMPVGLEPSPNGGIVNIGAYGGTAEASKSYSHP